MLGQRWVYDGCRDPAWVGALLKAMMSGGSEATEFMDVDGVRQRRPSSVRVVGSGGTPQETLASVGSVVHVIEDGDSTRVRVDSVVLGVVRVLGSATLGSTTLTASWSGEAPVIIAHLDENRLPGRRSN